MAHEPPTAHPDPRCPRCGYDQRGIVAAWRDVCPLEGQCAECGLRFEWRDLLNPALVLPTWCIEHARRAQLHRAALATFAMMFRPRRFWRELKMIHPPRWRRFLVQPIVIAILVYVAIALSVGHGMWKISRAASASGVTLRIPSTLAGGYAALLPLSKFDNSARGGWQTPRSFTERYRFRFYRVFYSVFRRGNPITERNVIPALAVYAFIAAAAAPVGFLLLPVSRRICRVRWRHLARIWLYSFTCMTPIIMLDAFDQISGVPFNWELSVAIAALCITLLLLAGWWAAATRHYLRMRHAWAVGAAVVAVGYGIVMSLLCAADLATVHWTTQA